MEDKPKTKRQEIFGLLHALTLTLVPELISKSLTQKWPTRKRINFKNSYRTLQRVIQMRQMKLFKLGLCRL